SDYLGCSSENTKSVLQPSDEQAARACNQQIVTPDAMSTGIGLRTKQDGETVPIRQCPGKSRHADYPPAVLLLHPGRQSERCTEHGMFEHRHGCTPPNWPFADYTDVHRLRLCPSLPCQSRESRLHWPGETVIYNNYRESLFITVSLPQGISQWPCRQSKSRI